MRGHEGDPWRTAPDPSWIGAPALPAREGWIAHPYDTSRTWFRSEDDFPGARTMATAARWLATQAPAADRFLLFVDEFDPHEPFDVPEPWMSRYDPTWDGPKIIWPPYVADALAKGRLDERTAAHIRANYGAKLAFIDHQLGRVLDELDRQSLWDDTAVIVCTDHGHYLGEHDVFGKPAVPIYQTMGHIPMFVAWPGLAPGAVDALTTSVDLHATLCDLFGVTPEHRTHGTSLLPLLSGERTSVRDWALTGVWGREVQITDGHGKYSRAPLDENRPLSLWSNRWSTMPVHAFPEMRLPRPDRRASLDHMPGTDVPVIRQPFGAEDRLPFWAHHGPPHPSLVFELDEDPAETHNAAGGTAERELEELLRHALVEVEAPAEQYERLGLK